MFECYEKYCQNQRHGRCGILFDECDLIQNLHKRLCDVRDVSWTIHSLYIDEVQDFTQAELALTTVGTQTPFSSLVIPLKVSCEVFHFNLYCSTVSPMKQPGF